MPLPVMPEMLLTGFKSDFIPPLVDFSVLENVLWKNGGAPKGSVHALDLSLNMESCVMFPVATFFGSFAGANTFSVAPLPVLSWEEESPFADDSAATLMHCATLEETRAAPEEFPFDLSVSLLAYSCPSMPRLLPRSLKLSWSEAAVPDMAAVVLTDFEGEVEDTEEVFLAKGTEAGTWTAEEPPIVPFRPCFDLAHRDSLPVGLLLQSDYSWWKSHSLAAAAGPLDPLPVAASDSAMLAGDLECPGVSMVIALPPHLQDVSAPLLSPSLLYEIDVQRCSLVTLELQMASALLIMLPMPFADEKAFFRFQSAPLSLPDSFPLSPQKLALTAVPPLLAPVRFSDHLKAMDDDQFLACAKLETRRLIGYQDNGRGDIHHFLAMCAEFASHKHIFAAKDEVFEEPFPPNTPFDDDVVVVAPAAAADADASAAAAAPPGPAHLRPLSKRNRKEPVSANVAEERKRPKPVVVPVETLLNSYMKTRGVEAKKTWTLSGFPAGDDAASNKIVSLLSSGKRLVRVTHASPTKSLLSVCLLVAAKQASVGDTGSVVCVHEHLQVARQHLDLHAAIFSGISFGDRIKPLHVAFNANVPALESLPPKVLFVISGSDSFVRKEMALVKDSHPMVTAVMSPCDDQFDIVLSDAVPRVDYRVVPLLEEHRAFIQVAEAALGQCLSKVIQSPPPVRLLSASAVLRVVESERGDSDLMPDLLLLQICKTAVDLLGSRSVACARTYLESCFAHPVYGAMAGAGLSNLFDSLSFGMDDAPFVKHRELEGMLSAAHQSPVLIVTNNKDRLLDRPNIKLSSGAAALEDVLFPWSSFRRVFILDNPGGWEAAEIVEILRVKSPTCVVSWLLTDYEMTRNGCHMFWSSMPDAAKICATFNLSFDWKYLLMFQPEGLEDAPIVASQELLLSSPNLMSSLSSSLGLSLVIRGGIMAADLIIDEARCVLVRSLNGMSLDELCASL